MIGAAPSDQFFISQTTRLPAPFSQFTGEDALAAIFPSYRTGESAVREIRDEDGDAMAHVAFDDAKTWYVAGGPFVVVKFEIQTGNDAVVDCIPCLEEIGIAVLDRRAGRLHAVASNYGNNTTADIDAQGGDGVTLDLAPYRFDATRTMIGVRADHTTGPGDTYDAWLSLFLKRGSKLALVARIPLSAIRVRAEQDDSLDIEEARVVVAPRGAGEPNDLIVKTRLLHCPHDPKNPYPFTCDPARPKTLLRGWAPERYRYSAGGRYERIGIAVRHLS